MHYTRNTPNCNLNCRIKRPSGLHCQPHTCRCSACPDACLAVLAVSSIHPFIRLSCEAIPRRDRWRGCTNIVIIPEFHQQHHACMQVSSRRSGKRTTTPVPRSPTSCQTRDSSDSSWCDTGTACSLIHAAMTCTARPPSSSWCKPDVTQRLCLAVHMSGRLSLCFLTEPPPCM